jgi:hypothetical protein
MTDTFILSVLILNMLIIHPPFVFGRMKINQKVKEDFDVLGVISKVLMPNCGNS